MFFEGSEKKFEMILSPKSPSLLERPRSYWEALVRESEATIIGEIRNEQMIAYLLSESSLFIWRDRLTMITCGQTTLARAAEFFLKDLDMAWFDCLIFQRKNEFRSDLQRTSFEEDVARLRQKVQGEAYCFGRAHEHHNLLFSSMKPYQPSGDDSTIELLMYDVDCKALDTLLDPQTCLNKTRALLGLDQVLSDYQINDFCFDPFGYSLNAIKGELYLTIHVTPQKETSYISVETNADPQEANQFVAHFLEVLGPGSFDLITFNSEKQPPLADCYTLRTHSTRKLECGFDVNFYHYFHQRTVVDEAPVVLKDS